jgi:hypothetical protein
MDLREWTSPNTFRNAGIVQRLRRYHRIIVDLEFIQVSSRYTKHGFDEPPTDIYHFVTNSGAQIV